MAISVTDLGTATGTVGSSPVTFTATVPAGALIVVIVGDRANGTLADSAGNAYTREQIGDGDGELLVFEADNTAVVHNMDSPELFPYKPPQMRLIFDAFVRMLGDRAERQRTTAA